MTKPNDGAVRRFDSILGDECTFDECNAYVQEDKNGEYVLFEDYDALAKEVERLRAALGMVDAVGIQEPYAKIIREAIAGDAKGEK